VNIEQEVLIVVIEAMKKYEILYTILVPAFTRTKTSVWLRGILWFLWGYGVGLFHAAILFSHTAENTAQFCRFLIFIQMLDQLLLRHHGQACRCAVFWVL